MRLRRLLSACTLFACVTYLSACGDVQRARVEVKAESISSTSTTTVDRAAMRTLWLAEAAQRDDIARFTAAAIKNATAVREELAAGAAQRRPTVPGSTIPAASGSTPDTVVAPSGTCEQLVAKYFPDDTAWALRVARRESHCTAGAVNNEGCDTSGRTNSHALGVFQMCWPLHQPSFNAAGCNAPLELDCGIRAARALYDANGRGPWGG